MLLGCDYGKVCLLNLLDLSAAFDTIDHHILLQWLEKTFGLSGTVLKWFKSYLLNRHQTVVINGSKSANCILKYGVPQGSVLGPVLFTLYTQPLVEEIMKFKLCYHFYADDTQLYGTALLNDIDDLIYRMESCIAGIKIWMSKNRLMLNDGKTEAILMGSARTLKGVDRSAMTIADSKICFSNKVKNLGIFIDHDLSSSSHVNNLIRSMYLELRRIAKIRHLINIECAALLVTSLVLSKLDYCNSLLTGFSLEKAKKLQTVQNNAARIVLRKTKRESASPLLHALHWLPVDKRIKYKLATLCHRCLNNDAPAYLMELLKPYTPSRQLRSSSDLMTLLPPKVNLKTFGERSFSFCAPKVWNTLPKDLREIPSLDHFKRRLKTYLFTM